MAAWLIAIVIALILLKAAYREQGHTKNFSWNSKEVVHSENLAYALGIAALIFILAAVVLAK